jgi:ABC transporter DrrB family efflux protein
VTPPTATDAASVEPGTPTRAAPPLWWTVRDTFTVTKRNLRHFIRQPRLLVFSTIQPIMFVVLFAFVFGGVAASALPEGVAYIEFLLPGLFIQSAAFRSTQTAVGLAEDLERGVIDRFRSMPMSRVAVLAGRTFADLTRSLSVVALMVIVGYLIGFRFTEGVISAIGAVLVVGLFGYVLGWIFTYMALVVPGAEAAQTAGFVIVFPLVFASSIFVPVETMPSWLQGFATNSPVSLAADATRALSIGGPVARPLLLTVLWAAVILAIAIPASVRRYRRMT